MAMKPAPPVFRASIAVALLAATACIRGRSTPLAPPAATLAIAPAAPAASPRDAGPPPGDDDAPPSAATCARAKAEDAAAIDALPRVDDGGGGGGFDARWLTDACWPIRGGAWALRIRAREARPGEAGGTPGLSEIVGEWFVVHIAASGGRVAGPGHAFRASAFQSLELRSAIEPFDYDGDGVPELFVRWGEHGHSWDGETGTDVWTWRGRRVALYPGTEALHVEDVTDEDADGVPDLTFAGPFVWEYYDQSGRTHSTVSFSTYLAHARRDGTFAFDDAVAERHARDGCPSRPAAVVVTPGAIDTWDSMLAIRCARLWGESADAVLRAIRAGCKAPRPGDSPMNRPAGVCLQMDDMMGLASATPPLQLR